MSLVLNRHYRKRLMSQGLIYLGEEELEITIKDLSLTGILAELRADQVSSDIKEIFNALLASTVVDMYLPEMRLAGEADVVRVDIFDGHILIALNFKNVTYDVNNQLYKRKAYRKSMTDSGKILLDGDYREFNAVNVSVDGLMIKLAESIAVEAGEITVFEFERLELKGEIKVVWVENAEDGGLLIGLKYVRMENTAVKGIPRFAM